MGRGWRKAFCASVPTTQLDSDPLPGSGSTTIPVPNTSTKLGFLSSLTNPSTPRLRVRTSNPDLSLSNSTKLASNPCSPRSPFAILKHTLRISKSVCPICLRTLNPSQRTPIYTADCSHAFHFPCIASHVRDHSSLFCPVCNVPWKDIPFLAFHAISAPPNRILSTSPACYKDDEPLICPRFNLITEEGFCITPTRSALASQRNVDVKFLPQVVLVSQTRYYETLALVLRVKAPPTTTKHRPPADIVMVLDVSDSMAGAKLQMLKQAMKLVISSLSSADRLSIVVFASSPQRLLPLRRMTTQGQKTAGKIIDQLTCGKGNSADEALKKAAKILEDRRDKNTSCSVILLSDSSGNKNMQRESSARARLGHIEIPVEASGFEFRKCVGGLLSSVVVQDVRVQMGFQRGSSEAEITAIYSCDGRPSMLSVESARLGDMYAEEEREVLVEVRMPSREIGDRERGQSQGQHVMYVGSSYKDRVTGEVMYGRERGLLVPRPKGGPGVERVRNLFIYTRAVGEARRLVEDGEYECAHNMITSARTVVAQSEYARALEDELALLHAMLNNS